MKAYALEDLRFCHVKKCQMAATTIIERNVGGTKILLSYCNFHALIGESFFKSGEDRKEITGVKL
jgi:hypothetical protein